MNGQPLAKRNFVKPSPAHYRLCALCETLRPGPAGHRVLGPSGSQRDAARDAACLPWPASRRRAWASH